VPSFTLQWDSDDTPLVKDCQAKNSGLLAYSGFHCPAAWSYTRPKKLGIIGTKKYAIEVAKKMQALLQKMKEQLHNHAAIYVDIASPVANSVQAKLQ